MLSFLMPRKQAVSISKDGWPVSRGQRTRAGVDINEETALAFSAVFLCTRIIAEPIAGSGVVCYRQIDAPSDRRQVSTADIPVLDLLNNAPNEEMNAMPWRERSISHQVNWGGGFSEIVRDNRGRVIALYPIHPARMSPNLHSDYREFPYLVTNNDGVRIRLRRDEVLHQCGTLSEDGIWGRGIIATARETIGGALATDRHAWAYWGSGGQPKGIVTTPGLKQKADRVQFRQEWKEIHGSPDSSEVVILPEKSGYSPISISNSDSQFIETRILSRKIICEIYRVPAYMIGERVLQGNVESLGREFLMYTLHPWVIRQESEWNRKLLTPEERKLHYFEHDFSRLLRGDTTTRMNSYRVGLTTGLYSINELCKLEGKQGIGPAGDIHYVPANMFTAEQMANGTTANGPHGPGTSGPGSDQSGSPGDSPIDNQEAMFDSWTRTNLTKMQRADLQQQLKSLEAQLEDRKTDWLAAARTALLDVLRRMLTKESNAAARASKSNYFESWVRTWYAQHEILMRDGALEAACFALHLAGVKEMGEPTNLAAWLRARNTEELLRCYNSDSREVFARKLAAWPTERAALLADEVLGKRSDFNEDDHPRDDKGQFGEGGTDHEAVQEHRDNQDASRDERRQDERDRIDDSRDAEDKSIADAREKGDEDRESDREKSDELKADARDKEDNETAAKREQEEKDIASQRAKEDSELAAERAKEDAELAASNASQDKLDAINESRAEHDDEVADNRANEDGERQDKQDAEDADTDSAREKEDAKEERRREKEDRIIERKREREDNDLERDRDKEDRDIEKSQEQEDRETTRQRNREDRITK